MLFSQEQLAFVLAVEEDFLAAGERVPPWNVTMRLYRIFKAVVTETVG